MKFSIIMSVWQPWHLVQQSMACVLCQSHRDWELIVVSDGGAEDVVHKTADILGRKSKKRVEMATAPRREGIWGNHARRMGLDYCQGDYVCWVNHDNIVFPDYLAAHAKLVEDSPGCVSVVRLSLWSKGFYHGVYPRSPLRRSHIDLMNYAMPLEVARKVDAFGPAMEHEYSADWDVFEQASKHCPVKVANDLDIVGIHL